MQNPKLQPLLLALFGLLLGLIAIALAAPFLLQWLNRRPANTEFASLEEFQRALLGRDARDVKSDRSVSFRSIIVPHPSPRVMYDLLPKLDVKFQGVPLRTNSCGLRSPEAAIPRAPRTLRLALLGDSFAFGWGVEQHESFAQVIEDRLNAAFAGNPRVEVLNFGVPGYSTFQEVALFEEKGLDFDPDAVLVYFVENDFGLPFFVKDVHRPGNVVDATSFARNSWQGKDAAVNEQQRDLARLLDPNRALQHLIDITRPRGTKLFLAINPRGKWKQDYARLWILRRKKPALKFIPLPKLFKHYLEEHGIPSGSLSLPNDPHPNAHKHRILGELMAERLARQL